MSNVRLNDEIHALKRKYKSMPLAAKATFWFFLCSVLQKGIQILTIPIITRMLSASEYGIFSVFSAYGNIVFIFATLSLYNDGYNVGMKKYVDDRNRYTSAIATLMILLTTIVLFVYLIFNKRITKYIDLGITAFALMFLWVYCQGAVSLWYAENRYWFKYRAVVISTVFTMVATPALKIILIHIFDGRGMDKSIAAMLGMVLPVTVIAVIAWIQMFSKGKSVYVKEYWKFALVFNIPLIPYYLSQNILNQADRIMIERLDSASAAGIYSVAYSIAFVVSIINQAINSSFTPWQFQKMKQDMQRRVARVTNILMIIIASANMFLIFIAPEAVKIFAAKEYAEAIYVIPPVTVGVLLIWITQIFINVEFYYENNKLLSVSSVLSALLNVLLNAIAIPKFGYIAAGYTTLICYLTNTVFHGFAAVRLLKIKSENRTFDLGKLVVLTVVCIAIMFACIILYSHTVIRYGLLIIILAVMAIKRKEITSIFKEIISTISKKA